MTLTFLCVFPGLVMVIPCPRKSLDYAVCRNVLSWKRSKKLAGTGRRYLHETGELDVCHGVLEQHAGSFKGLSLLFFVGWEGETESKSKNKNKRPSRKEEKELRKVVRGTRGTPNSILLSLRYGTSFASPLHAASRRSRAHTSHICLTFKAFSLTGKETGRLKRAFRTVFGASTFYLDVRAAQLLSARICPRDVGGGGRGCGVWNYFLYLAPFPSWISNYVFFFGRDELHISFTTVLCLLLLLLIIFSYYCCCFPNRQTTNFIVMNGMYSEETKSSMFN